MKTKLLLRFNNYNKKYYIYILPNKKFIQQVNSFENLCKYLSSNYDCNYKLYYKPKHIINVYSDYTILVGKRYINLKYYPNLYNLLYDKICVRDSNDIVKYYIYDGILFRIFYGGNHKIKYKPNWINSKNMEIIYEQSQ